MNHPLLSCPDQTTNTSAHDSSMVTIQDYQLYIIIFNGKNICCTRGLHKLLIYLFKWEKTFDISAGYTNFNYSKRISVFEFRFSYAYVPSDLIELLMTVTDCSHCSANSERWQSLSNRQLLTLLDFFFWFNNHWFPYMCVLDRFLGWCSDFCIVSMFSKVTGLQNQV
jgi:hypothetical protein